MYGFLSNSIGINKIVRVDRETGEVYYRISNSFIENSLGLSPVTIKSLFNELEDSGYVNVMVIRKPNKRVRYVKFNILDDKTCFDMFPDMFNETICSALKNEKIIYSTALSIMIKKINVNKEEVLNKESFYSTFGGDLSDDAIDRIFRNLEVYGYICHGQDETIFYTNKMLDLAKEYKFSWMTKNIIIPEVSEVVHETPYVS